MPTHDHTWRTNAACLGADPEMFTPLGRGLPAVDGFRMCRDCPVRTDCLEEALEIDSGDDCGVWGGTSGKSRREIRMGRMTVAEAMARGDAIADRRAPVEPDEPWLSGGDDAVIASLNDQFAQAVS